MDVVDEQLDVIGKGFLAQTVTCARCHDHKFDPIPTKDYYALAGILRNAKAMEHANVSKWVEVPLPGRRRSSESRAAASTTGRGRGLQARIKVAKAKSRPGTSRRRACSPIADVPGIVVDDAQGEEGRRVEAFDVLGHLHRRLATSTTRTRARARRRSRSSPELPASRPLRSLRWPTRRARNRSDAVPVTVFSADGEKTISRRHEGDAADRRPVRLAGRVRFEKNGQSFVMISNEGTKGHVTADAVVFIPVEQAGGCRSRASPKASRSASDGEALGSGIEEAASDRPEATDGDDGGGGEARSRTPAIHVRGSVHNLGDRVPRGFLQVRHLRHAAGNAEGPERPQGTRRVDRVARTIR